MEFKYRHLDLFVINARSHSTYTILNVFLKGSNQILLDGRSEPPGQSKI